MGRRLHIGAAAVAVAVLSTTAIASASTLGGVTVTDVFAQSTPAAATVPRMRVADSFTSGTFESGRVPQDRSYLSRTWTVTAGSWSISAAGTAKPQVSSVSIAVYDVGTANIVSSVTLARQATTSAGIIVRSDSSGTTYLFAEFRNTAGGSVTLQAINAGVSTTLASASNIGSLSVVPIAVEAWGNSIIVRYNSLSVLDHTLVGSDASTFGALTSTGLRVSNGANESFDNFYSATWPAS